MEIKTITLLSISDCFLLFPFFFLLALLTPNPKVKHQMLRPLISVPRLLTILAACLSAMLVSLPARAAGVDPYVVRYLHVTEPIALKFDEQGETRLFSPTDVSKGKQLFQKHCMSCHVGGATLPNPQVSLSLQALQGASPPRDNIKNLVAYFREPMLYDGSEESYVCRRISPSWMSEAEVTDLAAFLLTAADKAPGWGTDSF